MKKGQDISLRAGELYIVHHNMPGQKLSGHSHGEHHLFIPLRGRIQIDLTGQEKLNCPAGKMVYLPANVEHSFVSDLREGERLIVLIEGRAWKKRKLAAVGCCTLPAQQLLKELLFFMLLNRSSRAMKSLVASFLESLSEALLQSENFETNSDAFRLGENVSEPRLKKSVEYFQENFCDNIKISQAAKAAGLGERSLNRLFISEIAMTPKNYLMRLRMEEAAQRLSHQKNSVTEVAFAVGYNSLSAFIEAFRAVKGCLPSDYAKTHR